MDVCPSEPGRLRQLSQQLCRYPILAARIRRAMRRELIRRGLVPAGYFETSPGTDTSRHPAGRWDLRNHRILRARTDAAFAAHLPLNALHTLLETLSLPPLTNHWDEALQKRLQQAAADEAEPSPRHGAALPALLADMVSSQAAFLALATEWFTIDDVYYILEHRIGSGRIGGKAAGLLLASRILEHTAPDLFRTIAVPRSYFIGADVFTDFLTANGIDQLACSHPSDSLEELRAAYPVLEAACARGRFPEEITEGLRVLLQEIGHTPLIVRSSSLLEDSFQQSFAGKYTSVFCPNQGCEAENLQDLIRAVQRTYASVFNPDAILYRRQMGCAAEERMAVLLQRVQGQHQRHWYFPSVAGVAYSYSPFSWNPRLDREQGFTRLVMGLGTRAVERSGNDYARMVHLSHPQLRPEVTPREIRRYTQRFLDLLDLDANTPATQPVHEVLRPELPALRWLVSVDDGDTVRPPVALGLQCDPSRLVLTFDRLLQRTPFVTILREILSHLSAVYGTSVDIEYAACLAPASNGQPILNVHLLQCRPQRRWHTEAADTIPEDLSPEDTFLVSTRMVPLGSVRGIEYVVVVDPAAYQRRGSTHELYATARQVGRLNQALADSRFLLLGPGRWGSSDPAQGVPVTYSDIYHARALIEWTNESSSEPSYGTHFFQDLIESRIYPLTVSPDEPGEFLHREFIRRAHDHLPDVLPLASQPDPCLKLIHIPAERPGCALHLVMDGTRATAFFAPFP